MPQHKECFGYQWLTESNRNTNYLGNDGLCDDGLSTGWYRFGGQAGSKMATSCVPGFRCATLAPSWLDGIHPTVAEGKVTRKVCYSVNDCCLYSNYIEVVNCGKYYVYELSKPPACNLRYCGSNNWWRSFHLCALWYVEVFTNTTLALDMPFLSLDFIRQVYLEWNSGLVQTSNFTWTDLTFRDRAHVKDRRLNQTSTEHLWLVYSSTSVKGENVLEIAARSPMWLTGLKTIFSAHYNIFSQM